MDIPAFNVLSLCSGYGGLDLGVELATGGATRTVCYVEREAFAAAILASRMEEKAMAQAPIWSDLRTFDGRPWRGLVDCITGGYPCQPFSHAGKRLGEHDERHLWPEISRLIGEIEPGIVFFENVAGHLTLGFDAVRADLERLGYRVAAGLFSAAEVGAPHRRERLFILGIVANGNGRRCEGVGRSELRTNGHAPRRQYVDRRDGEADAMADAPHDHGRGGICAAETSERKKRGRKRLAGGDAGMADAGSERPQGFGEGGAAEGSVGRGDRALAYPDRVDWGGRGFAGDMATGVETDSRGREEVADGVAHLHADLVFPPGPNNRAEWERIIAARPDLAPAVEPEIRGVVDGSASRLDRLRALGNGVVPLVGAYAFTALWACLFHGEE